MSNTYQAVYDAVRSRVSGGNIGEAVESALRDVFGNADHLIRCAVQDITASFAEHAWPSAVYRPSIRRYGKKWRVLYGSRLSGGISGFGDTPEEAMRDFDKNWHNQKPTYKDPDDSSL